MEFEVITIFPDLMASFLDASLLGRARKAGLITVTFTDPRDFTGDVHRSVDDTPYGGGVGMVMKAEPILLATEAAQAARGPAHRILLTPSGRRLEQVRVRELALYPRVLMICGRYEGVDDRVSALATDEEISIGDFVLSGGEVAAMVLIDAVARLIPGVLGEIASAEEESFSQDLLEYPQYTRPAAVRGLRIPEVLLSGDHERIRRWRHEQACARTKARRPDLWARRQRSGDRNESQ